MRRRSLAALAIALVAAAAPAGGARAEGPVHAAPEAVAPLAPGDRVPQGELHDVHGKPVALRSLVKDRGALLVFYRGGW